MIAAHTGAAQPTRTGNVDLALAVARLAQDVGNQIRDGLLEVVRVAIHRLDVGLRLYDDGLVAGAGRRLDDGLGFLGEIGQVDLLVAQGDPV